MKKFVRMTLTALVLAAALMVSAAAEEATPVPAPADEEMTGQWDAESWAGVQTEGDPLLDPSYGTEERTYTDENGLFPSGEALYNYWQSKGWPEAVGDVWSADGTWDHLIVAVVDGDQAVIDGIRAQMADPDCLTFTSCKYSRAQLEQVVSEIEATIKENKLQCILGVWIGVRGNDYTVHGQSCVHVDISTLQPFAEEWAEKLEAQYGDMLELHVGATRIAVTTDSMTSGNNMPLPGGGGEDGAVTGTPWTLWAAMALAIALGGLCLFAPVLARRMTLRTADGRTVTAGGRVTRSQAEAAVRESAAAPSAGAWEAIQKKLD